MSSSALIIGRDLVLGLFAAAQGRLYVVETLVLVAAHQANVSTVLSSPDEHRGYANLDEVVPDEIRRPVSVNRLAQSLGVPFETTRRHVLRLADAGLLTISAEGVVTSAAASGSASRRASVLEADRACAEAYRRLHRIGYFNDIPRRARGEKPALAPQRAVARLGLSYALRVLQPVRHIVGDYVNALLLLEMTRQQSLHLGDDRTWAQQADFGALAGDEDKAPVAIGKVIGGLGLARERARRRLVALADAGLCRREGQKYYAPVETVAALAAAVADENRLGLNRLYRQCAELGAIECWAQAGMLVDPPPQGKGPKGRSRARPR